MKSWQWLTQPEHIPVLTALVALVAAVVGGVVSQIVAGIFKTRGDKRQLQASDRQLAAAEKRWQAEQEFERQKLYADQRRELFIRAAHQLQRAREVFTDEHDVELEHGPQAYIDGVTYEVDKLFLIETECLLIAPDIASKLRSAAKIARKFRDSSTKDVLLHRNEWLAEYKRYTREAMDTMRALLGTQTAPSIEA